MSDSSKMSDGSKIEVLNSPTRPATDDVLVNALIALANGADVVLLQRPQKPHRIEGNSALVELRSRFAELLRLAVHEPKRVRDRFLSLEVPEEEDALDEALLEDDLLDDEPADLNAASSEHDDGGLRQRAFERYKLAGKPVPPGFRLADSLEVRLGVSLKAYGFSLDYYHHFPDLETALSYAFMLLLDARKPYGAAISQCQLARCSRFFLAGKKKGGGRPNHKYCCPEHLEEHHNSAARKSATTARARARKHK